MRFRIKLGFAALTAGIVLTLGCHLLGSWELMSYGGSWRSVASDTLCYEIPCYDAYPKVPEVGRVVLYCGFGLSIQDYFPLAIPLLRAGYAVRIVAHSGSQNSDVVMSYESHLIESMEATLPFLAERPDLPHFLMGHSEGTRYAANIARDVPSVDGVVLISTVSASMNVREPANILILVAENDFDNVTRQTDVALIFGTGAQRPEFDRVYGDFEEGSARKKKIVPGTDHFSIISSETSNRDILGWLGIVAARPEEQVFVGCTVISRLAGIFALVGTAIAVIGVGLLFSSGKSSVGGRGFPAWAVLAWTGKVFRHGRSF